MGARSRLLRHDAAAEGAGSFDCWNESEEGVEKDRAGNRWSALVERENKIKEKKARASENTTLNIYPSLSFSLPLSLSLEDPLSRPRRPSPKQPWRAALTRAAPRNSSALFSSRPRSWPRGRQRSLSLCSPGRAANRRRARQLRLRPSPPIQLLAPLPCSHLTRTDHVPASSRRMPHQRHRLLPLLPPPLVSNRYRSCFCSIQEKTEKRASPNRLCLHSLALSCAKAS